VAKEDASIGFFTALENSFVSNTVVAAVEAIMQRQMWDPIRHLFWAPKKTMEILN
jgi:hypothetical protein